MKKLITTFFVLFFIFSFALSQENSEIVINQWLKTNTLRLQEPLFNAEKDAQSKNWSCQEFLNYENVDPTIIYPGEDKSLKWNSSTNLQWQKISAPEIVFENSDTLQYALGYAGIYLYADQWMEVKLTLNSSRLLKIWLDGKEIAKKETDDVEFENKLKLETGKHLLLIKTLGNQIDGKLSGTISADKEHLQITTDPTEFMTLDKLLYSEQVKGVKISCNGDYVAVSLSKVDEKTKKTEHWLEIRNNSGELIQSFTGGMEISSLTWSPVNNDFIYRVSDEKKSTLWLANIESGKNEKILEGVENLSGFSWSPTGDFLIYSVSQEGQEDETGVRLLRHMPDRQPGSRNVTYLYKLNIKEKTSERLTFGQLSTHIYDISENGKRAIISRYHPYRQERPYDLQDYYILHLESMETDSLFSLKWATDLQWSPDGEKLLITGGVSMFGGIGKNLPGDVTPNDFDGQAFIYYLKSKKVLPVTKNFNPAIIDAKWSKVNENIYFVTEDRSWRNLYEYNVDKNRFQKIETGLEALSRFDLAAQDASGVYYGSGAAEIHKVCTIDFNKKLFFGIKQEDFKIIYEPAKADYKNTKLSNVKRWTFENKDGVEIEGRYYLPPNFDSAKKYPCIVYYYGGTSPVSRDFDGRYPKNYWAANGYVVYVLQPSGATGFGQEFAARHVNEWGSIVPEEIILGTEKFVQAHSFIDKDRLGCIGASYGGFTTESLITKTDIFAAAVSHAGISAVPSYWGEGYWGYSYGAVANANTFPWSHPEVFMKNSALYNADKINTPLLMTHGTADTNVPPGESIQLYTALKLLGKEVELLQCKDQNHFVLEYGQREIWSKSIIAWFDKHLKKDADWWNELYPSK